MMMIGIKANHAGGKNTATIGRPIFARAGKGLSVTASTVAQTRISRQPRALIGLTVCD